MAWIKVEQSLLSHRKTLAAADRLGVLEVAVVGHLVGLWTWALDNASTGVLPSSTRIVAHAARWEGDADFFVGCLEESGFIDVDRFGTSSLHGWEEYAGNLIRQRAANAERVRRAREKKRF